MNNKNTQLDILKQQLKLEDTRYEKMLQRIHPIKQKIYERLQKTYQCRDRINSVL